MSTTNGILRAVRMSLRMSQDDLARALREAGDQAGRPNDANKRLVQRWESGAIATPRPSYVRALEVVTGLPIAALGFDVPVPNATVSGDDHGGHDLNHPPVGIAAASARQQSAPRGNYAGIWLSRYEYFSSGRKQALAGRHYVVVIQHSDRLTVRSLPGSASSSLTMDLTIDGSVITGTWVEQTDQSGYYRGARYHGAVQMLADPSGRRIIGKWVGFGKEMDVNTGPWELVFESASTNRATLDEYNRLPAVDE